MNNIPAKTENNIVNENGKPKYVSTCKYKVFFNNLFLIFNVPPTIKVIESRLADPFSRESDL